MKLEIWFEFASTYSYLTVCRAESLLNEAQIDYEWRPFLLGPIFKDKGLQTSPFVLDEQKGAYMWRDVERRAKRQNLPFARPLTFPMNGLKAARIATAARDEAWSSKFIRAVFDAQFAKGSDISDDIVLGGALTSCGADPEHWMTLSEQDEIKRVLRDTTEKARAKGIFGAPSFVVGTELFWGDDRLEDAIAWATGDR